VKVPYEKKVNITAYYLTVKVGIWWNIFKDRLLGPYKVPEELRTKFYPVMVQQQKEKESMELKMSGDMTIIQYARKFMVLFWCSPEFVSSERLKMRIFEEGLAYYICNQFIGQSIHTYQELWNSLLKFKVILCIV